MNAAEFLPRLRSVVAEVGTYLAHDEDWQPIGFIVARNGAVVPVLVEPAPDLTLGQSFALGLNAVAKRMGERPEVVAYVMMGWLVVVGDAETNPHQADLLAGEIRPEQSPQRKEVLMIGALDADDSCVEWSGVARGHGPPRIVGWEPIDSDGLAGAVIDALRDIYE